MKMSATRIAGDTILFVTLALLIGGFASEIMSLGFAAVAGILMSSLVTYGFDRWFFSS